MNRRKDRIEPEPDSRYPGDSPIPIEAWLIVMIVLVTFIVGAFAFAKLVG